MQVLDDLTPIRTHIDDHAIAGLGDAQLLGRIRHELEEMVAFAVLPLIEIIERLDVLARNHKHMLRSLRICVAEREEGIAFEHDVAGYVSAGNSTEDAVVHGS